MLPGKPSRAVTAESMLRHGLYNELRIDKFQFNDMKRGHFMNVWNFIQNQILGMKWLNAVIGKGLSALGLDTTSRWGGSIQFFLYDVIKITVRKLQVQVGHPAVEKLVPS